jgi:hypothetical protein
MVAAEAQRRNLSAAESQAFLGDGGLWIWAIHRRFFPKFEPIVDFVHVLTYVYLAARPSVAVPRRSGSGISAGLARAGRGESLRSWRTCIRPWTG